MADTPASDSATLASINNDNKRRSVDQVDVRQAEAEFNQLQRHLSIPDHDLDPQSSTPQPEHLPKDLEKAPDDDEERFDLREYLASSNDASQAAGIKHKHVGVTWEDLEVTGIGGENSKESFNSYLGIVCSPLTSPPDLRSNVPRCDYGDDYVPRNADMGTGFTGTPCKTYTHPSNSHDHSQVSLAIAYPWSGFTDPVDFSETLDF